MTTISKEILISVLLKKNEKNNIIFEKNLLDLEKQKNKKTNKVALDDLKDRQKTTLQTEKKNDKNFCKAVKKNIKTIIKHEKMCNTGWKKNLTFNVKLNAKILRVETQKNKRKNYRSKKKQEEPLDLPPIIYSDINYLEKFKMSYYVN